jgi:hypothetical protein
MPLSIHDPWPPAVDAFLLQALSPPPLVLEWKKVASLRAIVEARDPAVKVPISFLAPYQILA